MAILKNVEVYHTKLDPKRPNASFNKNNPTWELQIRTADPTQKAEWEAEKLRPKLMVYKEGHKDADGEDIGGMPILNAAGKKQWRVNLKKKSLKRDGSAADPVQVFDGNLSVVDPNTIGNGSIAHVRVFQYEYTNDKPGATSKTGWASVLMGVQLKRHIVYTPKPGESFEMEDSETIHPDEAEEGGEPAAVSTLTAPSPGAPRVPVDARPETAF